MSATRFVAVVVPFVALGVILGSPLLSAGVPVGGVLVLHRIRVASARRRHHDLAVHLPVYVDELIQQLKAGSSLTVALRRPPGGGSDAAAPVADALAPLQQALAGGARIGPALDLAAAGAPPGVDLLLSTVKVLVDRGGPALPSLERLSDTLRTARSLDEEARTQAGQATASSAALAGLPVLFVAVMALADHRLAAFYLRHGAGAACLLGAAVLSHVGWWWMQRLIGEA